MARGRIAVQIQAAGWFQHAVKLDQAHRHHRQIGHHVIVAEERSDRVEQIERLGVAAARDLIERLFGMVIPMPGVLERLDLRIGQHAGGRTKQDVIIGVRIERRVEIDQIDAVGGHMLPQHVDIVTVEKVIGDSHALLPSRPAP